MKNYKYIALFLLAMGSISCENTDFDPLPAEAEAPFVALNTNGIDFSRFVSVGASFTAGFTDNGLFIAGQENSFPNILATKFNTTFNQPLMNDNFGGLAVGGNRILEPRFVFGGSGPVPLESVIGGVTVSTDIVLNNPTGPFNNLGVPGAKSFHMIAPGYGSLANFPAAANPYAIRLTGTSPNKSMLELAVEQNPTFFTLSEVGGNDILGFATSGGDGSNPITPTATFDFALTMLVNGLTANGAKGAIGNLPNITSLSFFTTVAHNAVPLDEATAAQLNAGYAAYNGGLQQAFAALSQLAPGLFTEEEVNRRTINFTAGQNAVVIVDENLTDLAALNPAFAAIPQFRQATAEDLILLTASSLLPNGGGTATPLSDTFVLTPQEQQEIATATDAYNASIANIAASKGIALVDLNAILVEASQGGVTFDESFLTTDLVTGGLISLDGVHLTSRGYAKMANAFLEAIDATYGSNFGQATDGLAKADDYPTNYSPTLR
ncbi:G-D-S-L family lipolytic protein [uncultured Polaribacter sp.]|uniref:G-D-S-L family lipolytic protein n=1 Tax=uncultured Polaribacter sp. TaxID=174711 RepID=UPI002616B741|nr:G-D-S-L family lipolytic protein [uncultured Polaribacter sp.]